MVNEELLRGSCGDGITYTLTENDKVVSLQDETGVTDTKGLTLTISGKGEMTNYESSKDVPWKDYKHRITNVTLENGVKNLGARSLDGCINLTEVKLPRGMRYVGDVAFKGCASLRRLRFPEGMQFIGPKAFEKCTSLEKLTFPSSFYSIDFKAFNGLDCIKTIEYRGSEEEWDRCVRVADSASGNDNIYTATFKCKKESSRFYKMCAAIARLVKAGGDGKMHVFTPNLTTRGVRGKSGDCALIVFPQGKTMLIDTGAPFTRERVMEFVKSVKITHYDYLVLSHPHGDHTGNALEAAKYIMEEKNGTIANYWYSGYEAVKEGEREVSSYLSSHGTKLNREVREGQTYEIDGVKIEIFNPDEDVFSVTTGTKDEIVNNVSVAMKFTFGESTYLTAGDLYRSRERYLAEKFGERLEADVIKANHHCAFTSNYGEWLGTVKPKFIISPEDGGYWTAFDERIRKAKIKNYKVSECGMVAVTFDGTRKYKFKTEF